MSLPHLSQLLQAIKDSPVPLNKTQLLSRTRRNGITALDSQLQQLINLSEIEEITRDAAWTLKADVRGRVPSTKYYRARPEYHNCHFCGEWVSGGFTVRAEQRHWLSDCRPDLVKHERGRLCTWWYRDPDNPRRTDTPSTVVATCYAYQDRDTNKWTDEHEHFYKDGPM